MRQFVTANLANVLFVFLSFVVASCGTVAGWQPRTSDWRAQFVRVQFVSDPGKHCPRAVGRVDGCTVRVNETKTAHIFIREGLPARLLHCMLDHEWGHAMGRDHAVDAGPMCGPKDGL